MSNQNKKSVLEGHCIDEKIEDQINKMSQGITELKNFRKR